MPPRSRPDKAYKQLAKRALARECGDTNRRSLLQGRSKQHAKRVRFPTSSPFLRRPGGRFLFLLRSDADLFQERLDRLFAAKEFLDGGVDVARIPRFVNFATQSQPGLLIEVTILRFLKDGRHVGGYRVGPGISVIPGIVAIQVTKVGNERRARINWQENFFQNRIRNR